MYHGSMKVIFHLFQSPHYLIASAFCRPVSDIISFSLGKHWKAQERKIGVDGDQRCYISLLPIAAIKTMTKSNLWRKELISFYSLLSIIGENWGRKLRQKPADKHWSRATEEGCLLTCSQAHTQLPLLCLQDHLPRHSTAHLPHPSIIKKMPYRLVYRLIWWRLFFSSWGFLFADYFSLCQADKANKQS